MAKFSKSLLLAFFCILANTNLYAHSPVEFLEVFDAKPARPIDHAVELKSVFDAARVETTLTGPNFFSRAVGCMNRPVRKRLAYLNWLSIAKPRAEKRHVVSVLDMVRGGQNKQLTIGGAEFFLTPAQVISDGAPDPIPHGLDHYKAYRVLDAPAVDRSVAIVSSTGPSERKIDRPLFVCLPVQEWHHDEYFAATHSDNGFVVYELSNDKDNARKQAVSTIDQFGLNALTLSRSRWLCVSAVLLDGASK